jgi:cobalt/nickel transport system permease protein
VAAWTSAVVAALLCSLELICSGTAAPQVVIPAMVGVHALIGIGEAALTVAALAVVGATRPDLWPVLRRAEAAE